MIHVVCVAVDCAVIKTAAVTVIVPVTVCPEHVPPVSVIVYGYDPLAEASIVPEIVTTLEDQLADTPVGKPDEVIPVAAKVE